MKRRISSGFILICLLLTSKFQRPHYSNGCHVLPCPYLCRKFHAAQASIKVFVTTLWIGIRTQTNFLSVSIIDHIPLVNTLSSSPE